MCLLVFCPLSRGCNVPAPLPRVQSACVEKYTWFRYLVCKLPVRAAHCVLRSRKRLEPQARAGHRRLPFA